MTTESSGFDVTLVLGPIISLALLGRMVIISIIMFCFPNVHLFVYSAVGEKTVSDKVPEILLQLRYHVNMSHLFPRNFLYHPSNQFLHTIVYITVRSECSSDGHLSGKVIVLFGAYGSCF